MLDLTEAYGLTFAIPLRDEAIGRSLRNHGEFARVEVELLAALMRRGEPGTMIDVGANIGSVCLPLARSFGRWRVIAVEAQRNISTLLAFNTVANKIGNVEIQFCALGDERGPVDFPVLDMRTSANFGGLGVLQASGLSNEPVLMRLLDDIAPGDTRLVKIDVEGFEPQVLAGAGRVLTEIRPAMFIEANSGTEAASRAAMRTLFEAGARLYWVFAPFVTRRPLKGAPVTAAEIVGDTNVLALFDGEEPPWDLPACPTPDSPRPTSLAEMAYLRPFGF